MGTISLMAVLLTLTACQAWSAPSEKGNEKFITIIVHDSADGMQSDVAHAVRNYADFYLSQRGIPHTVSLREWPDNVEPLTPEGFRPQDCWLLVRPFSGYIQDSTPRVELELRIQRVMVKNSLPVSDSAVIREVSRTDWLSAMRDSGSSPAPMAEPIEFLIRRAVELMCEGFAPQRNTRVGAESPIYTTIYVDSTFVRNHGAGWPKEMEDILDVASRSLLRQFGRSLAQSQVFLSHADSGNLQQTFDALKRLSDPSDTLNIMFMERRTPLEYYAGMVSDHLGITDLGGSRIAVDCIPSPSGNEDIWFPFANGLALLHEMGHAFGGIHVFDTRSIMCAQLHWSGTDAFDSLNLRIMREVITGRVDAANSIEYVALVSRALRESRYPFADFPDFFWRYLASAKTAEELDSLTKAIDHEPFVIAADALNLLKSDDKPNAVLRWKQALESEPDQPVLLYYLALSSSGSDSADAMERAAALGLYPPRTIR